METSFIHAAKALEPQLLQWRRQLHQTPEIGFDLPLTTAFVDERLREMGCRTKQVGRAGIVATVGGPGPVILLRADMDALPIAEQTGLPFASENGSCHACGHDLHMTALLGAARLLKDCEAQLDGTVLLVFQPDEEGSDGMRDMLGAGLLDGPRPRAAFAMHTAQEPTGSAGLCRGYAGASFDSFRVEVKGIGSHGAAPHKGVDPIHVASHIVIALQAMNSREVAPDAMLVATVCQIRGGDAHNILPHTCTLRGTVRAMDPAVRAFAVRRLREICEGVAATFRASVEVVFESGLPPMYNDPALAAELAGYIDEALGCAASRETPPVTVSEDFALLCEHMPSTLCWFGTGNADEGFDHSLHHPAVTFSEDAIHRMAAVYAGCAALWLQNHR